MKERPIIFSDEMVRAILDGRKTMTRRIIKPQPAGAWAAPGRTSCPYGQPGDRLWVREAWHSSPHFDVLYRADFEPGAFLPKVKAHGGWRPSIHMPRSLSRILLEITEVRVEMLQGISEEDAIAEGIERAHIDIKGRQQWRMYPHRDGEPGEEIVTYCGKPHTSVPWMSFSSLWAAIHGPGSWNANPWVWVIGFNRARDAD